MSRIYSRNCPSTIYFFKIGMQICSSQSNKSCGAPFWDQVSCFPATEAGEQSVIPCPKYIFGIAQGLTEFEPRYFRNIFNVLFFLSGQILIFVAAAQIINLMVVLKEQVYAKFTCPAAQILTVKYYSPKYLYRYKQKILPTQLYNVHVLCKIILYSKLT